MAARGAFTLALAGGATPRALYALLGRSRRADRGGVPWGRVHVWFGDERNVPPDHPDSEPPDGAGGAARARARRERAPDARRGAGRRGGGRAYQLELERFFGLRRTRRRRALDLVLLGLGADGHTASLFPGERGPPGALALGGGPVSRAAGGPPDTLTLPVLDSAREVLFLVSGEDKAEAVARVLGPAAGSPRPPAACVQPEDGGLRWIVDRAAAALLPGAPAR